ncbi:MAG: flavin reductase family protein [Rhodospirillales bacterium]|nr:flavin reductase family protein [Rhodospirillales bacterium]
MFYKTGEPHGLAHDPFSSCIVPRPIGWISTLSAEGIPNLAPYSFFNGITYAPPMVMFATNGRQPHGAKDSVANAEATGEFVYNMATWDLREKMNATSAPVPPETDEFELAGLETEPSELVKPPRVKASPVHMECAYHTTLELPCDIEGGRNAICVGRVIGVHIDDDYLKDGLVDIKRIRPLARLGYQDYTVVDKIITMMRPGGA